MPYSIIHLEIAKRKSEELKIDKQNLLDFLVWNLIVDFSYVLEDLWFSINRDITHYYEWENYFLCDFPKKFLESENFKKDDYLKLWYYYHLLLDKFRRDREINEIYTDDDIRNAFQISRKLNAKYDLENFLLEDENKIIIDNLYNYEFDHKKLPKVFSKIDVKILKIAFWDFIDYMLGKNDFTKGEQKENTKDLIKKFFNYDKHIELKNEAFKKIKEI